DQVSQPIVQTAQVSAADTGATPSDRAFELYLNGDFNATPYTFSTVNGVAVVDGLATGSYTLVDVQTLAQFPGIVIQSNTTTSIIAIFPSGPAAGDSDVASLAISAFYTDSVNQPTSVLSAPLSGDGSGTPVAGAAAVDPADIGQNVTPADRNFSIYLNGDLDSVPFATVETVGGSAVVNNLPVGTHAIVDDETGTAFSFTIASGSITAITLYFPNGSPAVVPTTAPGAPTVAPTTAPGGGTSGGGSSTGGGSSASGSTSVTALPNTGQGTESHSTSTAFLMLLGSISLIVIAAGITWRRRQSL
ncbi:MAG TPA: hypothetical protein VFQ54_07240, partial [Thermomicrobiales bacterium]|nr:hypothetical protein [Thermomicrobiales bacterium]